MVAVENKRRFRKLRISLTSACNFHCPYCVSAETLPAEYAPEPAVVIGWVKEIHQANPLRQVRLTGGEPLLYSDLTSLVRELKQLGIPDIALTTNASLLEPLLPELVSAGLNSLNVSLDAINREIFVRMGGKRYDQVLAAIEVAARSPLSVKINATVHAGINETEILPVFRYAHALGITVRYLEVMNMGHLHNGAAVPYVASTAVLEQIRSLCDFRDLGRSAADTAHYYELADGYRFGTISNHTEPFCRDCDRLRLDLRGRLYGCLSSPAFVAMGDKTQTVREKLETAIRMKQPLNFVGSATSMRYIGG
jgi:cyclic pyranopterin phosphate synthase